MYIIAPLQITHGNGVLAASSIRYPDSAHVLETAAPRWVAGRGYGVDDVVIHDGQRYLCIADVPASGLSLPPWHQDNDAWAIAYPPTPFSIDETYASGAVVSFPVATYTSLLDTDPALTWEERYAAASVPTFTPSGYPAGAWRRNSVPDDGESLLPMYPSLASKYWDLVEPPIFVQFPEIPAGELTTYKGRVWRKRTEVMAAYEAPPSAPLDWAFEKTSNRYAMFDASVQSQTKQTYGSHQYPPVPEDDESFYVKLTPGNKVVDAVAFLNLAATSVRVLVQAGSPMAAVYDRTVNLVSAAGANNWYEWFFATRHVSQSLILDDLPPVPGSTITITITNEGGQAACGACIVGKQTYIGDAQYGAAVGIKDYSIKNTDEFGNITTKQRAYSDRLTVSLILHNDLVDSVKRLLTTYRTTPLLWVGHPSLPSTIVYGYYRDFSAVIAYPKESTCNLEIEGLT